MEAHSGGRPALRWLGHATVLLELDGLRLLTDPVLRDRVGPLVRVAPSLKSHGIGSIDLVLLSHLHADHTDLPSLRRMTPAPRVLAPYPAAGWLTRRGVRNATDLRVGEQRSIGSVRICATRALHDPRRHPLGPAADPVGYVVRGSRSVYFAGDTDLTPEMADLRGSVDVALLPVWGWGDSLGPGHLDPARASQAAALIAPAVAVPIHWGTFRLRSPARRRSDLQWPARQFAELTRRLAPEIEVRVLAPGERTVL